MVTGHSRQFARSATPEGGQRYGSACLDVLKAGEHTRQGASGQRGHIEGFTERDEADAQCGQFLQRHDKIGKRMVRAGKQPDEDGIHFATTSSGRQLLSFRPLQSGRANLLQLDSDCPAQRDSEFPHGVHDSRKGLLVVGRDASSECDLERMESYSGASRKATLEKRFGKAGLARRSHIPSVFSTVFLTDLTVAV